MEYIIENNINLIIEIHNKLEFFTDAVENSSLDNKIKSAFILFKSLLSNETTRLEKERDLIIKKKYKRHHYGMPKS